jgi:crossover junction endodeoxyribonuclease RuvC
MGYGLLEDDFKMVECGVLKASRRQDLPARLANLYQQLLNLIDRFQPEEIAVEEPFVPRIDRDVRTAITIGQAQAVVLMASALKELPVHRYLPAQIRSVVVGYGAGTKSQVQEMLKLQLGLEQAPTSQDASDALAVAVFHLNQQRLLQIIERQKPAQKSRLKTP